jgi:GT2 family glycosyltransferase
MTATWCTDLELSAPIPDALRPARSSEGSGAGQRYDSVRVLVRLHGAPIGFVEQPLVADALDVTVLLKAADADLLAAVNEHLAADGVAAVSTVAAAGPARDGDRCASRIRPHERVSVVVCTRDRPEILRGCLDRLRRLEYPNLEILIVDNAPPDGATREVVHDLAGLDPRFRYVREPRPGLSCARNRGLQEATGTLIAYTDDDVSVDPDWVRALAVGFRTPGVACVTGLVCTASIDGPAERYFDARVSWGDSCRPALHRIGGETDDGGLFPYSPGIFGTGASFAVRADVFRVLGGFDEALGAGTLTAGGEDLDAFVRIVLAGHALAYEPSAVVWHHHRSDLDGLRRQMFAYGTGLSAFLAKHLSDGDTRREVLRRIPRGARRAVAIGTNTHGSLDGDASPGAAEVPTKALLLRELAGLAVGPVLYARARRAIPRR